MIEMTAPCLFGLEGPLASELRKLGIRDVRPDNGRVSFSGTEEDLARANISLRTAERVLVELGSFPARTFDELFEGVRALPWERFIPLTGAFPVKGYSLNSALHSIPDCQKIIKKAAAERLGAVYGLERLPESGALYQIQFSIMRDRAALYLDSSGAGLHKRGYRPAGGIAPLRETLAAAMIELARYRGREDFHDPFCGSGTIVIEAALTAKNRAPGLNRTFSAENWETLDKEIWRRAREEARTGEFSGDYRIIGSDIDPKVLELARQNAGRAGVGDIVKFEQADAREFSQETARGIVITNPPYGERMLEKRGAEELYRGFGEAMRALDNWSVYVLSSHEGFEDFYGRRADKKRKLYNGMIKCELYMYENRSGGR